MSATVLDIPGIMRAKGWTVGAELMDHWFSLPSAVAPPFVNRDDTIVTMAWALGFPRAREVYDKIIAERVWTSAPSKRELRAVLARDGYLSGGGSSFGVFRSTLPVVHRNAVNYRSVNQSVFTGFDDMAAALANFNFHIQVGGEVSHAPSGGGRYRVRIDLVGIYIRDQYDFTGDQELGFWDASTNDARHTPWFGFTRITNETFRDWRTANGRGGDFEVFSDVKVESLAAPDVFEI